MKFIFSHYLKKRSLKIAYPLITALIFSLPINKGLSNEENPLDQVSIEISDNQVNENYFSICEEILIKMEIPELQEKIIEKSYSETDKKIQNFKDNALTLKLDLSENELDILSQHFVKTWNTIYFEKMQFDTIKIKIARALMTKISYQELLDLNNTLKSTQIYALPQEQKITLSVIYNTAQEVAMNASIEAQHEIQKIITAPVSN